MMDQIFKGKVALITGGGKGIGLGIAEALVRRGATVVITGRNQSTLNQAISTLGASATAIEMDVRDEASVVAGVERTLETCSQIDILVNNAGIGLLATPILETTTEAWRDVIETNLTGSFLVTRAVWPSLLTTRGQILNVSSIAGTQGYAGSSAYCASKFAVNGLTEVLKKEGEAVGIRTMSLCPAQVSTDIWGDLATEVEKERMMTSEQIGELAAKMLETPRNIDLGKLVIVNSVSPWS